MGFGFIGPGPEGLPEVGIHGVICFSFSFGWCNPIHTNVFPLFLSENNKNHDSSYSDFSLNWFNKCGEDAIKLGYAIGMSVVSKQVGTYGNHNENSITSFPYEKNQIMFVFRFMIQYL